MAEQQWDGGVNDIIRPVDLVVNNNHTHDAPAASSRPSRLEQNWAGEVAQVLCEFLEVAVHAVLHARAMYAEESFETRRAFGMFVRRSRHAGLCDYIHTTIHSLKAAIESGALQRMCIVFRDDDGALLQCFDFCARVEAAMMAGCNGGSNGEDMVVDWDACEGMLRGALLTLQRTASSPLLPRLPAGAAFEIMVCSRTRRPLPLHEWVEHNDSDAAVHDLHVAPRRVLRCVKVPAVLSINTFLITPAEHAPH